MDTPFEIGRAYWLPRHCAERVTIPCPACKGTRIVTIIYGDEHVSVDCDGCAAGFEGSKGTVMEYDFTPVAEEFTVEGPTGLYGNCWSVKSTDGRTAEFNDLCETKAAALAVSAVKCADQHEQNMQSRLHARGRAKHSTWAISYHKKCIVDLERQLAWHTAQINAGKVKKEKA